jgi:hypothetical protein
MLKVIKDGYTEFHEECFMYYQTHKDGGFSFPCDNDGNILPLTPAGQDNYKKCISGEIKTISQPYIQYYSRTYNHPRVCECECGDELHMECDSEGLVYCHCGRCYNMAGNSIRPRSEWEERYEDDY